jgi:flagellar basal body-associated protein FliL
MTFNFPIKSTLASIIPVAALAMCAGCYNGSNMVQQAQSAAQNTRLAEVDLGKFQTTLPRDPNTQHYTALDIHIFATVPRYQLAAVNKQLTIDEFRVRHETLAAVRQSTREELAEPNFAQLRARIEKVVNGVLADAPVKEIGFYQLTMRQP